MHEKGKTMTEVKLGAWGTGKSAALKEEMTALAGEKKRVLFFVPDQFSFEAERQMYIAAGARNIRYIKVTSFAKIAREILTKYRKVKPYADDTVKLALMLRTVADLQGSLDYFGEGARKTGFAATMLKAVASFKNAGITAEELKKSLNEATGLNERLLSKTSDIQMIYAAYDQALTAVLDDKLDDVSRSAAVAEEKGFFAGCYCFFDNFDSFSGTQRKLLSVICKDAEKVTVCLSEGSKKSARCIERTLDNLEKITDGLEISRYEKAYRRPTLKIAAAKNPFNEADYIAAEITRLVREEKLRYRDILVLTPDSGYELPLADAFQRYQIPAFFDFPQPVLSRPAARFVLKVLEAAELKGDAIASYLQSGFVRVPGEGGKTRLLSSAEINRLLEAAERYSFGDEQWLKPIHHTLPQKAKKGGSESYKKYLDKLEQLRLWTVSPLENLNKRLEAAENGREFTEILVKFLVDEQGLKSTFLARSKAGSGEGTDYLKLSRESMDEYGRLWDKLTGVFDSLAYCLDKEKMTIAAYRDLLENVLAGMAVAKPPAVLDAVTVGDTERTRRSGAEVLFVCGAWEGAFPRGSSAKGVFTPDEQDGLLQAGVELEETGALRRAKERYYAERSLALPKRQAVVSCPCQDFSGTEREISYIIGDYQAEEKLNAEEMPVDFYSATAASCKSEAAKYFNKNRGIYDALAALTLENKAFYDKLEYAERLSGGKIRQTISSGLAEKLFSGVYSPTRLDSAFTCLFQHFCKYGLGLRDKADNDISSPTVIGTVTHEILQNIAKTGCLTDENADLEQIVRQATEQERERLLQSGYHDEARVDIFLRKVEQTALRLAESNRLELLKTGFVPTEFEKELEYKAGDVTVRGIADRIDIKLHNGEKYVRICDYKTGKKELDMDSVRSGLDLQMLLYLFAYCDGTGAIPAAVEYRPSGEEPALRSGKADYTEQKQTMNWFDTHKASGLAIENDGVFDGVEEYKGELRRITGAGSRKSFVKTETVDRESFDELRKYIEADLIGKKAAQIKSGDISPLPLIKDENFTPCGYCPFSGFCTNKDGFFGKREGGDR